MVNRTYGTHKNLYIFLFLLTMFWSDLLWYPVVCFPLTLLEPQSAFGDKPLNFQVVCPQNGTAVLKGLIWEFQLYLIVLESY